MVQLLYHHEKWFGTLTMSMGEGYSGLWCLKKGW